MGYGNRRPPLGAQIDFGHPLAPLAAYTFTEGAGKTAVDLVSGLPLVLTGGAILNSRGIECSSTGGAEVTLPSRLVLQPPLTIACHFIATSGGAVSAGIWQLTANNTNASPFLGTGALLRDGLNNYVLFRGSTSLSSGVAYAAGVPISLAGTVTASQSAIYTNGISRLTGAGVGSVSYASSALLAAGNYTGVSRNPGGIVQYGYLWSRALAPSEIAWLTAEPYSMVYKPKRKTYFVAAGSLLLNRRRRAAA